MELNDFLNEFTSMGIKILKNYTTEELVLKEKVLFKLDMFKEAPIEVKDYLSTYFKILIKYSKKVGVING